MKGTLEKTGPIPSGYMVLPANHQIPERSVQPRSSLPRVQGLNCEPISGTLIGSIGSSLDLTWTSIQSLSSNRISRITIALCPDRSRTFYL